MNARFKVPVLLFLGSLLIQTAWILALPPFRGIDEFDHAYRAAAVSDGQWKPAYIPATHGRGDLLVVPRSIIKAATPVCESYKYTGPDNCNPVADAGNQRATVASAAARYNPVFYWIVGQPAGPFTGAEALYVMRFIGAVLCAVFIALAGWAVAVWARTRWPLVATLVAMTPVMMYSTAVPAPNGVEMCAGMALWVTLLGVTRPNLSPGTQRALLCAAVPSALFLSGVRSMGPLWLALIVLSVLAILGIGGTKALVRSHPRLLGACLAIVAAGTLTSVWWTSAANANQFESEGPFQDPIQNSLQQMPLWFFQSIAAFPTRNEPAPVVVYAAGGLLLLSIVCAGLWVAPRRVRTALVGVILAAIAVPLTLSLMTYSQAGPIWQGRYGWPFSMGAILVAGLALEMAGLRHRLVRPVLVAMWGTLLIAHIVSVTNVLIQERQSSPLSGDPSWLMPQPWVIVVLVLLGVACWAAASRQDHLHHPAAEEASGAATLLVGR